VVNFSAVLPLTNDATSSSAYDIVEGASLQLELTRTAGALITTTPLPRNAVVKDGIFSFTPDYSQAGLYSITFTMTSGWRDRHHQDHRLARAQRRRHRRAGIGMTL
jgi:hypothetical protein